MFERKPTQQEKDTCIEAYHSFPTKEITLEMLKEERQRTGLGLMQCKVIIEQYILETYG